MIRADTGLGKTRLVQEFYRALAATSDPDGYWPASLPDVHKSMTIVPPVIARPTRETPALPWLWLALRCTNPGERNRDARGDVAFDVIPRQLLTHLAGLYRGQLARSQNTALTKSMISVVASFALPGSGPLLNALEGAIKTTDTALDVWSAFDVVLARLRTGIGLRRRDADAVAGIEAERTSLAEGAVRALGAIAAQRTATAWSVPIVLVVDDAHWADAVTIDVLDRILESAWREGWPLLTVLCAWDDDPADTAGGRDDIGKLVACSADIAAVRPTLHVHRLAPLDLQRTCELIARRLPGLTRAAIEVLARRCSGDLDLLFDFLDEIGEAPGWLDARGRLAVDPAALEQFPSQAGAMARRRLRTIEPEVLGALTLASAEGPTFHLRLAEQVAVAEGLPRELTGARLATSDDRYGITELRSHDLLVAAGEFRRHVYWEVCAEALARSAAQRRRVLRTLAEALRDLLHTNLWDRLSRHERARLGARLLEIVDELGLDGDEWGIPRTRLQLDLAIMRLEVGDAHGAIYLASDVLDRTERSGAERSQANRLLVEAACTLGDVELESRFLAAWRRSDPEDPRLLMCRAAFLLRQSAPAEAVMAARGAVKSAAADSSLRVVATTVLAHAQWSAGQSEAALATVASCERDAPEVLRRDADAQVAVDHSFALILHDLELNLRVAHHADRCVQAYRSMGRLEPELISRVNLGDALWGAGRITKARSVLDDVWAHAEAAGLPHAQDIAAICLANVLSSDGQGQRALELYDRGIELGLRIGHDWDEMYGRTYRAFCAAQLGHGADPDSFIALANRASQCRYHYLADLACALAPLALIVAGDDASARETLGSVSNRRGGLAAPGPAAYLATAHVLLARRPSADLAGHLVACVCVCEGLKGPLPLALAALRRVLDLQLLDAVQARQATQWMARFEADGNTGSSS